MILIGKKDVDIFGKFLLSLARLDLKIHVSCKIKKDEYAWDLPSDPYIYEIFPLE